jgi:hypothetical protein
MLRRVMASVPVVEIVVKIRVVPKRLSLQSSLFAEGRCFLSYYNDTRW